MKRLLIGGGQQLNGNVEIRGAKNAALPILVCAAAGNEPVFLDNVPLSLNDVKVTIEALQFIGCHIEYASNGIKVTPSTQLKTELPEEITGKIRSSLIFLGLLAGKSGHGRITFPGGCNLGDRKFDLHLDGLRKLGANVIEKGNIIEVSTDAGLKGTDIHFYLPTTTGTETIMLAACFATGKTRIFNANTRPEVVDMANCLNSMGASIVVKNRVVEIDGNGFLKGTSHKIMSGWDEAMIYVLAAGMTGGEVCIKDFNLDHIQADTTCLRDSGLDLFEWGGNVYVSGLQKKLKPIDIFTAPYPGINSDMQPLFAAYASQCSGESTITDQRFTERFAYVNELKKLGMKIDAYGNSAVVTGVSSLTGANVNALDLRCGASLILAGLVAKGKTAINNIYQINRGYEDVVQRFKLLGADIEMQE